jgi:hypothetical protein
MRIERFDPSRLEAALEVVVGFPLIRCRYPRNGVCECVSL